MVDVDNCKHWDYILKNNTCSGCGAVICRFCLKEPTNCTSDKRARKAHEGSVRALGDCHSNDLFFFLLAIQF